MNKKRKERIEEILKYANKLNLDQKTVSKLTDDRFSEPELHALVWMFRNRLPIEMISLAAENETALANERVLIHAYHSDEFSDDFVFACLKNDDAEALREKIKEIDNKRNSFQDSLQNNDLFRGCNVFDLMKDNKIIYIRHEFNWNTYESRLVLSGGDTKLYFPMPEIPLKGSCWSNSVAERMLQGQMYLQYVFKAATASLLFLKETENLSCEIIPCDNCFYAPYLYFLKNEDGTYDRGFPLENEQKVYMDYLIKEYPEAYHWLMNRPKGKYFYDDFYVSYTPDSPSTLN